PFHYREFVSDKSYNFSPVTIDKKLVVTDKKEEKLGKEPFDRESPPLEYTVKAKAVINWKSKKNSLPSPPQNPITASEKEIKLIPYGCTYLRVTQFADLS
ncbi:MAG: hypothetical protein ACOCWI_02950, partial [Bacillota bacterium]